MKKKKFIIAIGLALVTSIVLTSNVFAYSIRSQIPGTKVLIYHNHSSLSSSFKSALIQLLEHGIT